jgi:hypothetical protein
MAKKNNGPQLPGDSFRAMGDTTFSAMAGETKAEVSALAGSRTSGTSIVHELVFAAGLVMVIVATIWLAASNPSGLAFVGLLGAAGGVVATIGVTGYRNERQRQRAMAARIDAEQRGEVG